jgi:predicted phage tail protein
MNEIAAVSIAFAMVMLGISMLLIGISQMMEQWNRRGK